MWAMRLRLLWLTVLRMRAAAEAVEVDYEVLEAVIAVDSAMDAGKPQIHPEAANNMIYDWEIGDADATSGCA